MQNPHEPEATYRVKGKKNSVGYAMNIVEARYREKGLSMIIHYEKQPNIFSDAAFGLNAVEGLKGGTTLVSDGSFYSEAMVKKAAAKNLNLSFSALNGRPTNLEKLSSTHFTINPETELITACPNRAVPVSSKRNQKDKFYSAKLDKKTVPLVLT